MIPEALENRRDPNDNYITNGALKLCLMENQKSGWVNAERYHAVEKQHKATHADFHTSFS